jgi:glycosyltransferase involved in cell wall biosynthesis/SAM-dependent methyltransferase
MQDDLEFTGERYVPGIGGNIFLEHMHRYLVALQYVAGKDVLDIASGEGFGSDLLAKAAKSVTGVDLSETAVEHANRRYARENLSFAVGSVTAIPLPAASFDVVVSFETIEHISEHEEMLAEIARVLRPGGILIISTPDKANYTDKTGNTNPFHVRELYRDEFVQLLSSQFKHITLHTQRISFGSMIACETSAAWMREDSSSTGIGSEGLIDPLYLIAVASNDPLAVPGQNSIFSQDIMASEPVLVRVDAELEAYSKSHSAAFEEKIQKLTIELDTLSADYKELRGVFGPEIARWHNKITDLQSMNWQSRAPLGKLLRRLLLSSLLYRLSRIEALSERRRSRFLKSAQKRDPFLLSKAVDEFTTGFLAQTPERFIDYLSDAGLSDAETLGRLAVRVSAIVPNFNHGAFLRQRLDSILSQTYPLVDIIILDDASTDNSAVVIEEYASLYPDRIKVIRNESNSGNVFRQWRKGYEAAQGDLIWICESDDFCAPDFLSRLLPAFGDPSVMLAFGRIQYADENGKEMPGLDAYRESAEAGIWDTRVKRPAHEWFSNAFGVKNVIANVGGSVWRRDKILDEDWEIARSFRVMGDWYLYSVVAGGGQIAFEPSALSYFRIHQKNTSAGSVQKQASYYEEYARLMTALKQRWNIPRTTVDRFIESSRAVFKEAAPTGIDFDHLVSREALQTTVHSKPHILIGFMGFSYGGGEIFPIHLANTLHRRGVMVSMLQLTTAMDHPEVRRMLDPGIPVYTADAIRQRGIAAFVKDAGVSLVHSHIASVEMVILDEGNVTIPYVASLHGSHEAMELPEEDVARWAKKMDRIAYTAERNLELFRKVGLDGAVVRKFRNAMPLDDLPFPQTRAELGIPEDAIVFSFVARGEFGKGWPQAVKAFQRLEQLHPERNFALLMVGSGPEADVAIDVAAGNERIHFLGLQQRIHGLYRMSDVALAPTRYKGESFPLCLIQAMQVGTPVIATDIGEIRSMLESGDRPAGLLLPRAEDDEVFVTEIVSAMQQILDDGFRGKLREGARILGATYSIDALAEAYLELYSEVLTKD